MQSSPLSFLVRKISPHLAEFEGIPLFGQTPFFDWKQYGSLLAARLGLDDFTISLKEQRWLEYQDVLQGLGANWAIAPVLLSPISTPVFWVMAQEEASRLASILLTGKQSETPFASEVLTEGYYRYLLLEALDVARQLEPLNQFTPQLSEEANIPHEAGFCIDIHLCFSQASCWGRLILPASMKSGLARQFAHLPYAPIAADRAREIELSVGVQVGLFHIALDDWRKIKIGDAVFLDRGSYHSEDTVATLMLGSIPVFQAKVEQNRLTILEYAFYYEEAMEGQTTPEPLNENTLEPKPENGEEAKSIQDYPISVAVELGRLKITLEQLMRLNAGNTLQLPIQPHQGVALTVNGRLIGRGEIVSLGEALAVRILEIA